MLAIAQFLQTYWIIPGFVILLIICLSYRFWSRYRNTAKRLSGQLTQSIEVLNTIKETRDNSQAKLKLRQHFASTEFNHAWGMYESTLHDEVETIEGEERVVRSRATTSSANLFSQTLLIDTPLHIEFFKHLPGLMTGIGIIGTFFGLLIGLFQFDPDGDPSHIQSSLKILLHAVGEAFVASGFAIFMAMVVTTIEKRWLRTCYSLLEDLCAEIDGLFEADEVGEKRLAQLVKYAGDSAVQAKILQDSLVGELKIMMTNLVEANQQSQMAFASQLSQSYEKSGDDIASKISSSIKDAFHEPLSKIANSVQQVSGDQSSSVQNLITDVLTMFMQKLETTFGNQMQGLGDMMAQSVSAMREMQLGFTKLIGDMQHTSEASSTALEEKMVEILDAIKVKQEEMSSSISSMVEEMKKSSQEVSQTSANASQQINEGVTRTLNDITGHMKTEILDNLSSQMSQVLEASAQASQSFKENINKLSDVSTSSIKGMNDGAEKMTTAADRFTNAGMSLSSSFTQMEGISGALTMAGTQLNTLLSDYQQSRKSVDTAIQALEAVVANAKQEAGMSSQMLNDMKQMTNSLEAVRNNMDGYLGKVNDVLSNSFKGFTDGMGVSLNNTLGEYDTALSRATTSIAGVADGFRNLVDDMEGLVSKRSS